MQLAIRSAIFATKLQTLLPHVINALLPLVVAYCITYFASRWTSTILSSSFGPYPERSELGTMTAVLLSTSVATLSANIYSGTYTVSTSPAQQSRLCVSVVTLDFIANLKFFPGSFFRGVLAVLGGLSVTYYHNLASLNTAGLLPVTTISLAVSDKKYRADKFFSCYRDEDLC